MSTHIDRVVTGCVSFCFELVKGGEVGHFGHPTHNFVHLGLLTVVLHDISFCGFSSVSRLQWTNKGHKTRTNKRNWEINDGKHSIEHCIKMCL